MKTLALTMKSGAPIRNMLWRDHLITRTFWKGRKFWQARLPLLPINMTKYIIGYHGTWHIVPLCKKTMMNNEVMDSANTNVLLCAGVIAGGIVGLAFAVMLVALMVYRMKKKDEGSYALDEHKPSNGGYQKAKRQEEFLA